MRTLSNLALIAALASPAVCADVVITQTKHTDATKAMGGREQPAKDSTQTIWIGKDRMRIEDGDNVIIVRADLKKMYMLDPKAKTASTIDLPVDLKKYMPPEMAPMFESMIAKTKVTVTPTTETKKIRDWNATKYTMTISKPSPMGEMTTTKDIWATKDVAVDRASWTDMYGATMSIMGGPSMLVEIKKIDGLPILTETTETMMGTETKSRDEVTSVATKDAPEGAYDVPKDYTTKPFDVLDMSKGGPGGGRKGGKPADAAGDKPKEGEKPK